MAALSSRRAAESAAERASSGKIPLIAESSRDADYTGAITYGFAPGPAGRLMIAQTNRGICRITIAGTRSRASVAAELLADWPGVTLCHDDERAEKTAERMLQAVRGGTVRTALCIHVRATPFQASIWRRLLDVPAGSTTTYSRLAKAAGSPRAARAVGNAVGRNPVGILIPCHRVIREDGTIGGFYWGPKVKRALLAWENANANEPETPRSSSHK